MRYEEHEEHYAGRGTTALGTIGTILGSIGTAGATGLLDGVIGRGAPACPDNMPINRYEAAKDQEIAAIQNNPLFAMLGIVDGENFNADVAAKVLTDGMGSDEFTLGFRLLGKDYTFYFTSADVQAIKNYL